jgi:hypothetical protein
LWELCVAKPAEAASPRELFTLGRSTNANVVKYAVRTTSTGELDLETPVEAYWLMLAEDGRREALTWTERQLAYGFSTSQVTRQGCRLRLAACSDRELGVRSVGGRYRAELAIAGRPALLQTLFVQTEQSLLPSVRYVEIRGRSGAGEVVSERLLPKRRGRF